MKERGDTKRRVTIGYLCSLAGITDSKEMQQVKNQLNLLPKLKEFMCSVLETEDEWIKRRVTEIILQLKERGCPITLYRVRKQLTIRQVKFEKYREPIVAMVEEAKVVTMWCPHCGSDKVCKDGYYKKWQKYLCRNPDCLYKRFKVLRRGEHKECKL